MNVLSENKERLRRQAINRLKKFLNHLFKGVPKERFYDEFS